MSDEQNKALSEDPFEITAARAADQIRQQFLPKHDQFDASVIQMAIHAHLVQLRKDLLELGWIEPQASK